MRNTNMAAWCVLLLTVFMLSCIDVSKGRDIGKRYLFNSLYHWGEWSGYTTCDDCTKGSKSRQRLCYDGSNKHVAGSNCNGYALVFVPCIVTDCTNNSCVDTYNKQQGAVCPASYCTDYRDWSKTYCQKTCGYCSVDGNWGAWGQYSACSYSCGTGTMTRYRNCNNPPPSGGGISCLGKNFQTTACNLNPCTVDGGWSTWTSWSSCSTSCGLGNIARDRNCDNPAPSRNGAPCNGNRTETHECSVGPCAEWSHWFQGDCSKSCGNGTMERLRHCSTGRDIDCSGVSYEMVPCNTVECI